MGKRQPHRIEAYGNRGFKNLPWRKTFTDIHAMNAWADKNDASILGTRERDPEEIAAADGRKGAR
jgi:hypothetical protein